MPNAALVTFDGKVKGRLLILGCPDLSFLTADELRACIAHEMAHLTGPDGLYTNFVRRAMSGLSGALEHMSAGLSDDGDEEGPSLAAWLFLYPPLLVLGWYLSALCALDASIQRARESRADMIAASVAGRRACASALRTVHREGNLFDIVAVPQILDALEARSLPANYYATFRKFVQVHPEALDEVEQASRTGYTVFDTHPAVTTRLAALPVWKDEGPQDDRPARDLLRDPDQIERLLTAAYSRFIRESGRDPDEERRRQRRTKRREKRRRATPRR